MSQANPMLQVKLTLQTQIVKDCLPLLLVLIDARVIRYDTDLSQHLNRYPTRSKLYEIYINPPKGTTDNQRWAEETFMKATKMGFPALIVRPAQEDRSHNTIAPDVKKEIVEAVKQMTPQQLEDAIEVMRNAQSSLDDNRNLDQVERNTQ